MWPRVHIGLAEAFPEGYFCYIWRCLPCAQVMAISQLIREEFDGRRDLSGIGGVETGRDAAEFLLLGANSVQVGCKGRLQLLHGS